MKIILPLVALFVPVVAFAQFAAVEGSSSPNGAYSFRVRAPETEATTSMLQIVDSKGRSQDILGSPYGYFDPDDRENSLLIIWAPGGGHFAVMSRAGKRFWETKIYAIVNGEAKFLNLHEPTDVLYRGIGAPAEFRFTRQTPLRWKDARHLELLLNGDVSKSKGNDYPMRYEAKALWDIISGRVELPKNIVLTKEEG